MKHFFEYGTKQHARTNFSANRGIRIGNLLPNLPDLYIDEEKLAELINYINLSIRTAVLNYGLLPKNLQKLAVISGAGIAGLAASLVLIKNGYEVVIAEKRDAFTRFNIINLDIDAQRFLKKYNLLEEFERDVAAKIKFHKYVLSTPEGMQDLGTTDVSTLKESNIPFSPEFFNMLFTEDGVYSVKILAIQNFLAKKALDAGVHIFGNVEINARLDSNKLQIKRFYDEIELNPNLLFIAEGAHSTTASQLGMESYQEINECTGESWIFGNILYNGDETFVVSVIDTSNENLDIANIIFNAKLGKINVAITAKSIMSEESIREKILNIAKQVFVLQNIEEEPELTSIVKTPVNIVNEKRHQYSINNAYCIGDTVGHSSPLAGMGGTLCLTLVPATVENLIYDIEEKSSAIHTNFNVYSDGYASRWINKSANIKRRCLGMFAEKKESEPATQVEVLTNSQSRM